MSNKDPHKHPNSRKTILTITEGGEWTYIHPYSYSLDDLSDNKFHILETEVEIDQNYTECEVLSCITPRYNLSYLAAAVRRFWKTDKFWGRPYSLLEGFLYSWRTKRPVFCSELYKGPRIRVPGTLVPSIRGQRMTDTAYLIPSQEWIKRKLGEWLSAPPRNDGIVGSILNLKTGVSVSLEDYERNSYLTWARKQVELGRKVAFLTSLDT